MTIDGASVEYRCRALLVLMFMAVITAIRTMCSVSTAVRVRRLPDRVRGMQVWDPEAFKTRIRVPAVITLAENVSDFKRDFGKYLLKVPNLPHVQEAGQEGDGSSKRVLLDPDVVRTTEDFTNEQITILEKRYGQSWSDPLPSVEVELNHLNWRPGELLKAVLDLEEEFSEDAGKEKTREKVEGLSSYTLVGHIAHVNLKEHLLPHKQVIGQILLLIKQVRLVVNKINTIDNEYRNFQMEVLARRESADSTDDDFVVTAKENGCAFRFDFSRVYWNSRLSTEHLRLASGLAAADVLFDVFAGVGPFAVPAAKRCSRVHANDLNPESFKWLRENAKSNKVDKKVQCYNKDGRLFIKEDLKKELLSNSSSILENGGTVHVAMNLPALAVEFLDAFRGLLKGQDADPSQKPLLLPKIVVNVYAFSKMPEDSAGDIRRRCESQLGVASIPQCSVSFVRNVAPNKDMMKATFVMPTEVLFQSDAESDNDTAGQPKRQKLS